MIAPSSRALQNSPAGVSFEVNMIESPTMPARSASSSSGSELQSAPNPSARRIFRMNGSGFVSFITSCYQADDSRIFSSKVVCGSPRLGKDHRFLDRQPTDDLIKLQRTLGVKMSES